MTRDSTGLAIALKTLALLAPALLLMNLLWDAVFPGKIYYCSDVPVDGFDFFQPGAWVHEPMAVVDTIDPERPWVHGGDAIRRGWDMKMLWLAWGAFCAAAVVLSFAAAWVWESIYHFRG